MGIKLNVLRRENAVAAWPDILPLVEKVVGMMQEEDALDVLGKILLGSYQVFLAVDSKPVAIAITQFRDTRFGKVCTIVYCSGEGLTEWLSFVDSIVNWCKAQGCIRVEGIGRKGWERVLGDKGFRLIATTLWKQL